MVLTSADNIFLLQEDERKVFLAECAKLRYRVKLASKEPRVIAAARKQGIKVFDKTRQLKRVLDGHPKAAEALRFFSPSLWRQQWRSRLQILGLLSVPKMRIWILIALSGFLFLFVVFRLLPSADVRVWPRADVITQTMNILLVASGAGVQDLPEHVHTLELYPITVKVHQSFDFDQISPEFIGTDAEVTMTLVNKQPAPLTLRSGTRLMNQAGMIFRLENSVSVPAAGTAAARAKADHFDIYEKVIGDRGNVPAGLTWQLPALTGTDKNMVYGINKTAGAGGRTAYRTVLQASDLDKVKTALTRELLAAAKQSVEEQRVAMNANRGIRLELLNKQDMIQTTYSGFILPTSQLGQQVSAVPVQGTIIYTIPAYDAQAVLDKFSKELQLHTGDGKQLLSSTIQLDPQRVVVIEYADTLQWIKVTVDIVGTEQFVLDPLTPTGMRFGKRLRDAVVGLGKQEALRIVKNFPEVEKAEIVIWPPWNSGLPTIPSNISITPQ